MITTLWFRRLDLNPLKSHLLIYAGNWKPRAFYWIAHHSKSGVFDTQSVNVFKSCKTCIGRTLENHWRTFWAAICWWWRTTLFHLLRFQMDRNFHFELHCSVSNPEELGVCWTYQAAMGFCKAAPGLVESGCFESSMAAAQLLSYCSRGIAGRLHNCGRQRKPLTVYRTPVSKHTCHSLEKSWQELGKTITRDCGYSQTAVDRQRSRRPQGPCSF